MRSLIDTRRPWPRSPSGSVDPARSRGGARRRRASCRRSGGHRDPRRDPTSPSAVGDPAARTSWPTSAISASISHRANQVHQLSEDHSYLWEQVKKARDHVEEAKRSPFSNVITRAVGITETVQVDTLVFDVAPRRHLPALLGRPARLSREATPELERRSSRKRTAKSSPTPLIGSRTARRRQGQHHRGRVARCRATPADPSASRPSRSSTSCGKYRSSGTSATKSSSRSSTTRRLQTVRPGERGLRRGDPRATSSTSSSPARSKCWKGGARHRARPGVHFGEMALLDHLGARFLDGARARRRTRLMVLSRRALYHAGTPRARFELEALWSFVQVLSHSPACDERGALRRGRRDFGLRSFRRRDPRVPVAPQHRRIGPCPGERPQNGGANTAALRIPDGPQVKP